MQQIRMRGKLVGVEKLGKSSKNEDSFLFIPESTDAVGIILYVGTEVPSDLQVGQKVYFGEKRTQIPIEGKDIQVMDADNVVAIVESNEKEVTA